VDTDRPDHPVVWTPANLRQRPCWTAGSGTVHHRTHDHAGPR
jgi:hypothetical protein